MFDFGSFGKFPWGEILSQTVGIIMAYFAGRYRTTTVNKLRREDDDKLK